MLGWVLSANAILLEFDDSLGIVRSGMPADPVSEASYINNLLGVDVADGWTFIDGQYYRRINDNPMDPMPLASPDDVSKDESGNNVFLLTSAYDYLVAKYDGWRGGDYVWYVGDLVVGETYSIPDAGFGTSGDKYGLSHVSLYNPTTVPDGGLTIVLLGIALSAVGIFRRFR